MAGHTVPPGGRTRRFGQIDKKMGMALTGIPLYGFLVVHLAGNLLLLKRDGGAAFEAYAALLAGQPLLVPAELGLLAVFFLHLYLAVSVTVENWRARPVSYQRRRSAGGRTWASSTMIYSGVLVLAFLALHLANFKYGERGAGTLYDLVVDSFRSPLYGGGYVLAMVVLGFHLWHALHSALQTLGLHASRRVRVVSAIFSLILAGGFAAIPLWLVFAA